MSKEYTVFAQSYSYWYRTLKMIIGCGFNHSTGEAEIGVDLLSSRSTWCSGELQASYNYMGRFCLKELSSLACQIRRNLHPLLGRCVIIWGVWDYVFTFMNINYFGLGWWRELRQYLTVQPRWALNSCQSPSSDGKCATILPYFFSFITWNTFLTSS